MLRFSNTLVAFISSVNFMFLCSYCATLGKLEGGSLGGVSCYTNKECAPNAYCIDGRYCMCRDDFVQDSSTNSCLPKSTAINDTCLIDIQCSAPFGTNAKCFKRGESEPGYCRCVLNTHFQDGLCYESVKLGGKCKVSNNCISLSNVPTYCAYSICVCSSGYHSSDDRQDCVPDIALGKSCIKDEECVAEHSYCSGVCKCQTGYIQSTDNSSCLLAAKSLGAHCLEDHQCQNYLKNTFCDPGENNCKCAPLFHEVDKTCWVSARLGDICSHPNQCITSTLNRTTVSCNKGICTCAPGYTITDVYCTKLKDVAADSSMVEKCLFLIIAAVLLSLPND